MLRSTLDIFFRNFVFGSFSFQAEAPILIHPFINSMTRSEIHAMMTAGYATISGTVLGAYVLFGVCSLVKIFLKPK